jgi:hypothetical protein
MEYNFVRCMFLQRIACIWGYVQWFVALMFCVTASHCDVVSWRCSQCCVYYEEKFITLSLRWRRLENNPWRAEVYQQIYLHSERLRYRSEDNIVIRRLNAEVCSHRSTAETSIARQRVARLVSAATNKHRITEELLEVVSSIRSFPKLQREVTWERSVSSVQFSSVQFCSVVEFRSCKRTERGKREWSESSAVDWLWAIVIYCNWYRLCKKASTNPIIQSRTSDTWQY